MSPIYDYVCKTCGNELKDVLVNYEKSSRVICDHCGAVMKKKMSIYSWKWAEGHWGVKDDKQFKDDP